MSAINTPAIPIVLSTTPAQDRPDQFFFYQGGSDPYGGTDFLSVPCAQNISADAGRRSRCRIRSFRDVTFLPLLGGTRRKVGFVRP